MLRMTLGQELKALDGMHDSRSWMSRTSLGCEFRALNAIDDSGSEAQGFK